MWIQTATGCKFDLLHPTPEQVHREDILAALPHIPCFTGQQQARRHEHTYSVAQHCLIVSSLVDEKQAIAGLLHDAWKVYVGDLTKPLNELLNEISFGRWTSIRNGIQQAVALRFNTPYPLPEEVEAADRLARATELRDIMAPPPEPWEIEFPPPITHVIRPYHPEAIRQSFARRWSALEARKGNKS
jgi:hypothetical protein